MIYHLIYLFVYNIFLFKGCQINQYRADSSLAPSQWEMSLQSSAISHWLGTNLKSDLAYPDIYTPNLHFVMNCFVLTAWVIMNHLLRRGINHSSRPYNYFTEYHIWLAAQSQLQWNIQILASFIAHKTLATIWNTIFPVSYLFVTNSSLLWWGLTVIHDSSPWIKRKYQKTTQLLIELLSFLYGNLHVFYYLWPHSYQS